MGEDGGVAAPSYRICFVCLGNICRSPMAAVVLRSLAAEAGVAMAVDSAGTGSWHVGGPADRSAAAALSRRGYDGSRHIARQFGPADFGRYDLVVGLDGHNVADLRRLAPDDAAAAKIRLLRDFDPGAPDTDTPEPDARDPDARDPDAPPADRDVPDPYGGPDAGFDRALDLVEAACRGLLAALPRMAPR